MVSIGIHFNPESLCVAELTLEKGQPKICSVQERFFETPGSEREKISLISNVITELSEKHKGKALRFCYGLSQNLVTNFFLEFPFKEKFKILKTLPFEIEDRTPFRSENVFFDARICHAGKEKSSVLCFVAPEDSVNEFQQFSQKLSAPPYLLSCEGPALANLLESWNKPLSQPQNPTKQTFYIYLGVKNSLVFFYDKSYLQYISVLDWSVTPIVQEMKKLYNLEEQKAWQEFFEKAFILTASEGWTKEQKFFSGMIKKHIQSLIQPLKLMKMSIETEQKKTIPRAVLFGPGAIIKNLSVFLTEQMSIPVSRLRRLPSLPDFKMEEQPSACSAVGLALEGLKSSPYPGLNFFQSLKKEAFSLYPLKQRKAWLALLLCFVLFGAYAFLRKKESSESLDKIQTVFLEYGSKIAQVSKSQVSVDSIHSFLDKEKAKMQSEQAVQDEFKRSNPIDYLQKIVQKTGTADDWGLKIFYLKIEDQKVDIKGRVRGDSLESFKARMQVLAKGPVKEDNKFEKYKPKEEPEDSKEKIVPDTALAVDPEIENVAFFSYSFTLKTDI